MTEKLFSDSVARNQHKSLKKSSLPPKAEKKEEKEQVLKQKTFEPSTIYT